MQSEALTAQPGSKLENGRIHADLSHQDLWVRYVAIGGDSSPIAVRTYLNGGGAADVRDHDLLVDALNERFTELGLNRPVPYFAASS